MTKQLHKLLTEYRNELASEVFCDLSLFDREISTILDCIDTLLQAEGVEP